MQFVTSCMTTVIVVDDDKNTVKIFSEYLQLKGLEIIGRGYDGQEAVDLFIQLKPDVVFLDVMMDGHDGFYALEKIREIRNDAIVIMVTADLTNDTGDRLSKLNASAIVYKPYNIDQIMKTITKLVPLKIDTLERVR